jgi:hypothetical protein
MIARQYAAAAARRAAFGEVPHGNHRMIDTGGLYDPYDNYIFVPYAPGMSLGDFLDERRNRLAVGILASGAVLAVALAMVAPKRKRRRR